MIDTLKKTAQAAVAALQDAGADKAQAIHDSVYGDIDPQCQASILRGHKDVVFLLDKAAASLL